MDDIQSLQALIAEIPEGTPALPEGMSEVEKESRRKSLIQLTLHASDISFLTRPWEA